MSRPTEEPHWVDISPVPNGASRLTAHISARHVEQAREDVREGVEDIDTVAERLGLSPSMAYDLMTHASGHLLPGPMFVLRPRGSLSRDDDLVVGARKSLASGKMSLALIAYTLGVPMSEARTLLTEDKS